MSKGLTAVALMIIVATSASGQVDADFGVINSTEAELTRCDFDPEAPAVVLVDKAMSDHDGEYDGLLTFRHTRIKVLKKEAIANMNFSITFRSSDDLENIDNIKAVVINFDKDKNKTVIPVDKNQIFRRKVSDRNSQITFAFPNVQVGSIIEYSYRFMAKNYGRLRDWAFQTEYPVIRSSYDLRMAPQVEMTYSVQKKAEYPIIIKPFKRTNSIYFEMNNIPGLSEEPFMTSREENLQMVYFEVSKAPGAFGIEHWMSTWDEVTKHLYAREDFGSQIKMRVSECDNYVNTQLAGVSEYEKMNQIYNYVRQNVTWNHKYGVVSEEGVRDAWNKKTGASSSINLLLINMLKTAGFEVSPMLVAPRGFGKINKQKPLINQFHNVFAAVTIGDKTYYLDATNTFEPAYMIPSSILHTTAFIANHKSGGLRTLEAPDDYREKDIVTVHAMLGNDKSLKGSVSIKSFDYSKSKRERKYASDHAGYAEKTYNNAYGIEVANFKFDKNSLETGPLVETFDFTTTVDETNSYWLLPVNTFSDLNKNLFLEEKRFSEVDFGQKRTLIVNYIVDLPAEKTFEELSKNVQLVNSDKSLVLSRTLTYLENTHQLVARIKFEQNKGVYTVEEYAELREFFKKMSNILDEQFVIKSK